MHCRDGQHRLPPECPNGHGHMVITPRGEQARCPMLTGRDERGSATWCNALRDVVTYGPGGLPEHPGAGSSQERLALPPTGCSISTIRS